jgi:hypothetical protein
MSNQNIPYIVGTEKNVDHVYPPRHTETKAAITVPAKNHGYLFSIPISTYIKWAWRIKKWTLIGNLRVAGSVYDPAGGDPPNDFANFTLDWSFTTDMFQSVVYNNLTAAASEKDILSSFLIDSLDGNVQSRLYLGDHGFMPVMTDPYYQRIDVGPPVIGGDTGRFTFVSQDGLYIRAPAFFGGDWSDALYPAMILGRNGFGDVTIRDDGEDSFWPTIAIGFQTTGTVRSNSGYVVGANLFCSPNFLGTVTPGSSITIDGVNLPMQDFWDSSGLSYCVATITPSEFWPYKNRLGQPVYDTATGAQINDPFS